jgi:hypothetical protein
MSFSTPRPPHTFPWKNYLTRDRMFCSLCKIEQRGWVRIGGPEILPPEMDMETFGRAKYFAALRRRFLSHVR